MTDYDLNTFALRSLLTLPHKNLETRIRELEAQRTQRRELCDSFLTSLLTYMRQLRRIRHSLRYQPNDIHRQLIQLELQIQKEQLSCFKDIAEVSDRISLLQEDMAVSAIKTAMLHDEIS